MMRDASTKASAKCQYICQNSDTTTQRNYTIPFPIHQLLCPNKTDTIKTQ